MHRGTIFALLLLVLATGLTAAEQPVDKSKLVSTDAPRLAAPLFPSPNYFKQLFIRPIRYTLEGPGSLRDLVQDGKLSLTVSDVVRLVVQRNTTVWLSRLDYENSAVSVLRTQAPFDPRFSSSFNSSRAMQNTYTRLDASTQLTQSARFSYDQMFASGTGYTVSFNGGKTSSNNSFAFMNPAITSNINFSVYQPLLRNRGFFIQRAPIIIARINQQVSRGRFEQIITDTVQSALNQYWTVVQARENLAVLRNSAELAKKSYERDKRALELGALPPLDIYRSEAELASRQVSVTTAEFRLKQEEDALRRLIAADIDPAVRDVPLNLMDPPLPPAEFLTVKPEEAIERALRSRPEAENQRRSQVVDDINIRTAMNGLKPDLRLSGNYLSSGLGGNTFSQGVEAYGGLSDALSQVFDFNKPTYGFGLTLSFPIRSRQAQADLAAAQIARRKDMYQQRELEQSITLEVRNAINQLEQAKENIKGATVARDLAKKNQEAEQRKYELGANTIFMVLDAQQRAADAETQLLAARIAYKKAVIALQRTTASLLQENNVVIEQALSAQSAASNTR